MEPIQLPSCEEGRLLLVYEDWALSHPQICERRIDGGEGRRNLITLPLVLELQFTRSYCAIVLKTSPRPLLVALRRDSRS